MADDFKRQSYQLHVPEAKIIADLFQNKLSQYFQSVSASVIQCPDLTEAPFHLAHSGLSGREAVCDVGGVPYLVPLARTDRRPYSLTRIADSLGYTDGSFFVGAAAGPFHKVGTNSELIPNFYKDKQVVVNETHCAKLLPAIEKGYELHKVTDLAQGCDEFCLLGNLFLCEGKSGPVVRVSVKKRTTDTNFVTAMRNVLSESFGEDQVSMGGVFLIKSGRAKLHVMPDFSKTPLCSDDDVNQWLQYFEASAPLICLTTFHSIDKGQDLRIEHTHCFSKHGDGGHYHYDTTPDEVEYEGYFSIAKTLVRIDAPVETHAIGRD